MVTFFTKFKKQVGDWHVSLNVGSQFLLYFFIVNGLNIDGVDKIFWNTLIGSIIIICIEFSTLRRLFKLKRLSYQIFLILIVFTMWLNAIIDYEIDIDDPFSSTINVCEDDEVKIFRLVIFSLLMIIPTISQIIYRTAREFDI